MKRKILFIIIFLFFVLTLQSLQSNAASTVLGPKSIVYPIPSEKKNGLISYLVEYDCKKTQLSIRQDKSWTMNKKDIGARLNASRCYCAL